MATRQLKILVIGGIQAQGCYLRPGQSFVEQLARRIEQQGQRVFVEYHVPVDLPMAASVLYSLKVHRYDLIILQLGHQYLQEAIPKQPIIWQRLVALGLKMINSVRQFDRLRNLMFFLSDVLHYLQPYGYKVILMTPIPQREPLNKWLCQEGRILFQKMGSAYGIRTLDTEQTISTEDEYFLEQSSGQLSPVGHELLGSALYEIYQGLQVVRPNESNPSNPLGPRLPRDY